MHNATKEADEKVKYINEKAEELNVLSNSLKTMFKSDLGTILTNLNEVTKLINDLNTTTKSTIDLATSKVKNLDGSMFDDKKLSELISKLPKIENKVQEKAIQQPQGLKNKVEEPIVKEKIVENKPVNNQTVARVDSTPSNVNNPQNKKTLWGMDDLEALTKQVESTVTKEEKVITPPPSNNNVKKSSWGADLEALAKAAEDVSNDKDK